jgi:uroporphyrinogen III methyltransferase/synthase
VTEIQAPTVYLVGAGPGDPGLITRRGLEVLRRADVVLFDRLVDPRLVDEAPPSAERVFVGKRAGGPILPQAAIDRLIVEHARSGETVVRLKGGDPFVFGRGADEAQALAAAGIAFEIVPGISSALAVPAYAGIPVTHSGMSSSFAVLTAHESSARPRAAERWNAVATGAGTLVLMMGVSNLSEVTDRLIAAGRDPDEAAAVIERGTTGDQRTVVAKLVDIADVAQRAQISPPAITIVGPVVQLRNAIDWFERKPLFGKRVIVTRPREQAKSLTEALTALGADVISAPTIRVDPPASFSDLDRALERVRSSNYEWIVFSSANAAAKTFDRLWEIGGDARWLGSTKIAAVGPATADVLRTYGVRPDLVPRAHTGEAVAEELGRGEGSILLPRPDDSPPDLVEALARLGRDVDQVVAYRTVTAEIDSDVADEIRAGRFDAVTFASGSAVRGFVGCLGPPGEFALGPGDETGKTVACIGPSTASVAEELGFRVDVVASDHTAAGLATALATRLAAQTPRGVKAKDAGGR